MPPAPVRLYLGEVDLERRVLEGPSGVVRLSPTEARLLGFLAAHPQREFSADDLLTEVWGYRPGVRSRTVTTTMQRLRAKVEVDPSKPRHLLTVDAGYTFVPLESHEDGEETLVGRQEVLTSVLAALRARTPLVTVTGPGGVGKTRLAREIAARAAGAEVSAVHLVELEDVDQPDEVIQRTGTALSLQGTVTAKRIRQALAGRAPALLVLDDLDRLADHARSAVEPLLGAPGVSVLVTSRRALAHPDEHGFALGPLAPEASRLVLSRVAAQAGATLEGQPDSVLGKLCEALDHLPLALVLAGAWLAHLSPEALLRNVEDLGSSEVGRHGSLEACLAASWDQLPADQRDDLCALALVGPSLPVDLAQTVLGAASLPRLEALRARSLVALEGRRVRILGTVRRFVEPRTAPELRKRVAEAWHQWAVTLAADFDGIGRVEPAEARRVVDALPLALAILDEEPPRPGWDEAVVSLTHLQLTTGFDEGIHRRVARLVGTAEARGDRDALATALHLRSQIEGRTGGEALEDLRAAIALADPDGGPARHFTVDLGAMLRLRRDLTGAREALEQALQRSRAAADPIVEARALLELGMLHRAREAHAEAVDVLRQAARLARRVGYRRLEMIAMGARATNERHLDHPLEAERLLRGAIAMAEELSDLDNVAHLKG
ncbi:MAG: winged helix-turn-helix domain-containing protein, partial [Myxococcota bacterium]